MKCAICQNEFEKLHVLEIPLSDGARTTIIVCNQCLLDALGWMDSEAEVKIPWPDGYVWT